MSNQQLTAKSGHAGTESRLSKLVDLWVAPLTGAEFKLAAYLYRVLEQNGGNHVRLPARELAEASGVSERRVEGARKVLASKGIIRLKIDSQGSWYGFPDASATPNASGAAQGWPASDAPQDGGSAETAKPGIQAHATGPAASAEALTAPARAAHGGRSAEIAEPGIQAPAAAPATCAEALVCAAPLQASVETSPPQTAPGSGILAPTTGSAAGSAKTAEPEIASADQPATAPASFQDKLTAALQQLTGCMPDAPYRRLLQNFVPNEALLLDCLHWMLGRGERFDIGDLLLSRIHYLCTQREGLWPSPFLEDRRRLQKVNTTIRVRLEENDLAARRQTPPFLGS